MSAPLQTNPSRLITIGISHYCEKARWAMERAGLPYVEEPHVPPFHAPASLFAGGNRTVPVLVAPGRTVTDSTAILHWVDEQLPEPARLFPAEPTLRAEVVALEERFDKDVGPHARRLTYFHLLAHRELAIRVMTKGIVGVEATLLPLGFPVVAFIMRSAMKIDAEGANRSLNALTQVIWDVNQRLADGRPYLCGDRFTAADLTFASLIYPVLWTPELTQGGPSLAELPAAFSQQVQAWRQTPAGAFGLRLYAQDRRRSAWGPA